MGTEVIRQVMAEQNQEPTGPEESRENRVNAGGVDFHFDVPDVPEGGVKVYRADTIVVEQSDVLRALWLKSGGPFLLPQRVFLTRGRQRYCHGIPKC